MGRAAKEKSPTGRAERWESDTARPPRAGREQRRGGGNNQERRLRRAFWVVVACNRFVYFARAGAERKLAAVEERMEESTHLSAG